MEATALVTSLLGGVGLFLLGMRLMTDGLRVAAGAALKGLLARWTGTRLRGILAGALVTAVVQSSSAVTVATIGFVNAGILSLGQSVAVIYGSNVGTTMTGWLVAVLGFHVDLQAFALPAIGVGMALRVSGGLGRRGALGEALAGFGVFFLGIDVLKSAFGGLGETIQIAPYVHEGFLYSFLFVGVGFLLTFVMQSSSAAMAITLTGAAGSVFPLGVAAAIVIGANLGTTSTAALAAIGATPNAKRVAMAHVVFNGITGIIAICILPVLLHAVLELRRTFQLDEEPAAVLALFHTTFNILGVLLLWPFSDRLIRFLRGRFRTAEEDASQPRFLDRTVVADPVLALGALHNELERIRAIALRSARGSMSREPGFEGNGSIDRATVERLTEAASEFARLVQQTRLPSELAEKLHQGLLIARYYAEVAQLADEISKATVSCDPVEDFHLATEIARFKATISAALSAAEAGSTPDQPFDAAELERHYDEIKGVLIRSAAQARVTARQLAAYLDLISSMRRMVRHAVDASVRLRTIAQPPETPSDDDSAPSVSLATSPD